MKLSELLIDWLKLRLYYVIALLALSGLLSACATPSPGSTAVQPPQTPKLPALLAKPIPRESYLERAQKSIEAWQQRLTPSESKP